MNMVKHPILHGIAAASLLLCTFAHAQDKPVKSANGIVVSPSGMTLYTFDKDSKGKSNCSGQCAAKWPPFTVGTAPKSNEYSTVKRDDGTAQLAYDGKPLYLYTGDSKPGDRNGDNVNGVWHVVKAE
jgi:predicted lipoprotein with Yx(FWY)xxD motif